MPGHFGADLNDASLNEGIIGPFVRDEVRVIPPASHSRNPEYDNGRKEQEWPFEHRPCRGCRRLRCRLCWAGMGVPARLLWHLFVGCIGRVYASGLGYPGARGSCLPCAMETFCHTLSSSVGGSPTAA